MAKKSTPTTAQPQFFNYLYIITWALMPVVYAMYQQRAQDAGLYPQVGLLALGTLVGGAMLLTKKTKPLPFLITLAAIAFFVLWHFAGYGNAIAKSLFWATFSRNLVFLSYLILTFQLLRNQFLSWHSLIKAGVLFGSISALSILPDLLTVLAGGNYTQDIYMATGWFTHKNFAASALLMALPFLYLGTRDSHKTWRLVSSIAVALAVAEIVLLRTRGVWLGFLAGVGATVALQLLSKQKETAQLKRIALGTGAFGLLLALVFVASGSAEKLLDARNIDVRFMYWERSVQMAKEQPITGVGAGNWTINFPKYGLEGTNQSVMEGETTVDRPHNDMLWVLAEMGVPAWIALAAFQILLLFIGVKLINHVDGEKRNFAMAGIFGLVAFAVYGLGEFPIERPVTVGLLVLLAAEALRLAEAEGLTKKPLFMVKGQTVAIVLVAFSVIGLWIINQRIAGEKEARKAVEAYMQRNPENMLRHGTEAQNAFFEIDIFNSPMQYFTGLGHLASQRFAPAEQEFLGALEVNPYHINTLKQLGDCYKFQKQYPKALARYDEALAISPQFYMANLSKVEIYLAQNDLKNALLALSLVSHRTIYPKYRQVGLEAFKRFKQIENPSYQRNLHAFLKTQTGTDDEVWQAYLDWKKMRLESKKTAQPAEG